MMLSLIARCCCCWRSFEIAEVGTDTTWGAVERFGDARRRSGALGLLGLDLDLIGFFSGTGASPVAGRVTGFQTIRCC